MSELGAIRELNSLVADKRVRKHPAIGALVFGVELLCLHPVRKLVAGSSCRAPTGDSAFRQGESEPGFGDNDLPLPVKRLLGPALLYFGDVRAHACELNEASRHPCRHVEALTGLKRRDEVLTK